MVCVLNWFTFRKHKSVFKTVTKQGIHYDMISSMSQTLFGEMAMLFQSSEFPNFKNISSYWVISATATRDSNPHN